MRRQRERRAGARIVAFARLIRWAIVASGTKNALAISAVVRPPTARSVSASCDAAESDGWQQRKSSVSVSSSSGMRSSGPGRVERVGREQSGRSRLAPLAREVGAELIGHASGRHGDQPASRVVRDALVRPLGGAGEQRFLDRVLGRVELAVATDDGAEDLRGKLPQQVLDADVGRHPLTSPSPASSMTGRISTQPYSDSGPATSIARSRLSTSTWKRPASSSLTSLYGPVGHGGHAV